MLEPAHDRRFPLVASMLILGDAVDRLRNGTAREQRATSAKIKQLALIEENRTAIVEAGAVVPLIGLLSHQQEEVQERQPPRCVAFPSVKRRCATRS